MAFSDCTVAMCLAGVTVSQQTLLFLAALVSAVLGLFGVVYDYLYRNKLREARRWRDFMEAGAHTDYDRFWKEWKARGLPYPPTHYDMKTELERAEELVDVLERKNDRWPLVFTGVAAVFAIFAAMLAYLLIP